jgi:hypothetical protein
VQTTSVRRFLPVVLLALALVLGAPHAGAQGIVDPPTTIPTPTTTTTTTAPTTTTAAPTTTAPTTTAPTTTAPPTTTTVATTTTASIPPFLGGTTTTTAPPPATSEGPPVLPKLVLLSVAGMVASASIVGTRFVRTRPETRNGRPRGGDRSRTLVERLLSWRPSRPSS